MLEALHKKLGAQATGSPSFRDVESECCEAERLACALATFDVHDAEAGDLES